MRKEKEIRGSSGKLASRKTTGVCKPKLGIIPSIQAHRDHITEHVIICKFMGLWLIKRALHV